MKNFIIGFIVAVLLAGVAFCSYMFFSCKEEKPLKVASWNLRFDNKADGENEWANRKEFVTKLIKYYDFDIFGTQECLFNQLKYLDKSLGFYDIVAVGRDDGKEAGETCAIFYKKDKFDLLDKGTFWYSQTPDKPSFGWDAKMHKRICSFVKLLDRQTGKKICVLNSHFDHIAAIAQKESAKMLREKAEEFAKDYSIFCMGDLNSFEDSEPMKILFASKNIKDSKNASKKSPYGPNTTYHAFKGFFEDQKTRIDYIFTSPKSEVLSYRVISDSDKQRFPSDHFPVFIEVVAK